jgi:hypothetical protein
MHDEKKDFLVAKEAGKHGDGHKKLQLHFLQ